MDQITPLRGISTITGRTEEEEYEREKAAPRNVDRFLTGILNPLLSILPGSGEAISAKESIDLAGKGDWPGSIAAAITALPLLGLPSKIADEIRGGANLYHRFTASDSPANFAGHMMFAEDIEQVGSGLYGNSHWVATDKNSVSADDLIDDIEEFFSRRPDILEEYQATPRQLAEEFNPEYIVNSAGGWDSVPLTEEVFINVIEPKGIKSVKTNDGLIVFYPEDVSIGPGYGD